MKTEVSAGGIVIRAVNGEWNVLLMKDMNNSWTFPKGIIETDESPKQAAKREIAEEVKLTNLQFIKRLGAIQYYYRRNGLIKKTVTYFLFISPGRKKPLPQREEGIKETAFFLFAKARSIIGYKQTNKQLLQEAKSIVTSL